MPAKTPKTLNSVEAACWLYNVTKPTQEQVTKVVAKIESGDLPRSPRGGDTTTAEGVAAYIARRESARGSVYKGEGDQNHNSSSRTGDPFTVTYQGVVKDIVLAALLRQKVENHTPAFQRAVLGTQAALFLGLVLFLVAGVVISVGSLRPTPEQIVAKEWLLKQYPRCEVLSLTMLRQTPPAVRARIRHNIDDRAVEKELTLFVRNNQVVGTYSD